MEKKLKLRLRSFKNYLIVDRGLEPITIKGYTESMRRILTKLSTLRPSNRSLRRYVAWLYKKNYSYSHIVNTCLAIERYAEFCHRRLKLGRPKKPKTIIKDTLSEAEVTLLLAFCHNIREKAILAVLAYSAIRNSELCKLRTFSVNIPGNFIRIIRGKGKKDRIVCITPECAQIIAKYLEEYPRKPEDFLFTTLRENHQYHTGDTRKLVKVVARRAGINKRVWPHLLRHSLATNLLRRGSDIFTVKDQLGHEYIETTMVYINSTVDRFQPKYQFYAPSYV